MLKFDVPYIPDGEYPRFLSTHQASLGCVHFSLHSPALSDARQLLEPKDRSTIVNGLRELPDTPRYVLINGRLHAPETYFSRERLDAAGEQLAALKDEAGITGIIFADFYYLNALSEAHPELTAGLEAVPSINTRLASAQRAFTALRMIADTNFKRPSKLILDRCLNRDTNRLEEETRQLKKAYPDMQLYLMANEGCLLECPFKPAHNAHISMVNEGICGERTFAMNRDFGCVRRLLRHPGDMLASPFIRPEDTARYDGLVDGIKLCGRNRGPAFLQRAVTAYLEGRYDGNLLDLMDAMGDLSDRVEIPNTRFPKTFFAKTTACDKHCEGCGWCAELAESIVTRRDPGLPNMS